jgi:hypothetical protein
VGELPVGEPPPQAAAAAARKIKAGVLVDIRTDEINTGFASAAAAALYSAHPFVPGFLLLPREWLKL